MTPRTKLLLAALTLVAAGYGIHYADQATRVSRLEDAFPAESFFAATLDVVGLKRSPVFRVLFGPDSGRVFGLRALEARCGFDPADRMDAVGFVVPEKGAKGEFGAAFRIRATPKELERCAESGEDRGPKVEREGDFLVVDTPKSEARLAYRPDSEGGGVLLLGKGTWLTTMIGSLRGTAPRLARSPAHAALGKRLGARALTFVATAVLPRELRERIRREMVARHEGSAEGRQRMSAVLGVEAAGLGAHLGETDSTFHLELTCETPEDCAGTRTLLEETRFKLQKELLVRLVAGRFLEGFEVRSTGTTLSAKTSGRSDDLARALERLLESRPSLGGFQGQGPSNPLGLPDGGG